MKNTILAILIMFVVIAVVLIVGWIGTISPFAIVIMIGIGMFVGFTYGIKSFLDMR